MLKLMPLALAVGEAPIDFLNLADKATGIVLLVVIGFGAYKRWWVPGTQYREIVNERDKLLDIVLKSQSIGTRALETAEKVISSGQKEEIT